VAFLGRSRGLLKGVELDMVQKQGFMDKLEENTNNNVIDLQALRQSIAGNEPPDENWLESIPVGTILLSIPNDAPKERLVLDCFAVVEKKTMSTCLAQKLPDGRQIDAWFPTLKFSRSNKLHEIIAYVEFGYDDKPSQEEGTKNEVENENGDSSGTV
jgi:hypothetical protein